MRAPAGKKPDTSPEENNLQRDKVLLEKETIYAEEVDLIMNGKKKEEVIAYMDEKIKSKEESNQPDANNTADNKEEDYVDKLLKMAEERAKQKSIEENKDKPVEVEELKNKKEGTLVEEKETSADVFIPVINPPKTIITKKTTGSSTKKTTTKKTTTAKTSTTKKVESGEKKKTTSGRAKTTKTSNAAKTQTKNTKKNENDEGNK